MTPSFTAPGMSLGRHVGQERESPGEMRLVGRRACHLMCRESPGNQMATVVPPRDVPRAAHGNGRRGQKFLKKSK